MHYMRNALLAFLVIVIVDVFNFAEGYSNTKSVRVLSEPNDDGVDEAETSRRAVERPGRGPERDAEWKWGNNRRSGSTPQARSDRLTQGNEYVEVDWDGLSCPKGATGAFPYAADCKKFYNCWKGRGMLSMCAPGTLFNSVTLECDYPSKALCYTGSSTGGKPSGNLQDATAAGSYDNPRVSDPSRPVHSHSHSPHYHPPGTHNHQPGADSYRGHSAAYHQGRDLPHTHRHHHHNHDGTFQHSEAYHRQREQYGSNVNRKTASSSTSQSGTVHSGVQPPVSNGQLPLDLVPPQPPSQIVPMYPPLSNGNSDSFQRAPNPGSGPSPSLNNKPYSPSSGFPAYPGSNLYNQSDQSHVDSYGQRVDNSYTQIAGYQPTVSIENPNNDETESPIDPTVDSDNFGIETEGAFRGTTYEFRDGKLYLVIPAPGSLIGGQEPGVTSRQIPSSRNPFNENTDTLEVGQEQDNTDIFSEHADSGTNIGSYQGTNSDRHETVVSSTSSQSSYVAGAAVTKTNTYQSRGSNTNNPTVRPQPNYSHRGSPAVVQPFPSYPGRKTQNSSPGYGQLDGTNQNSYQSQIPDIDNYDSPKGPESDSLHRGEEGQQPVDDTFLSENNEQDSTKYHSSSTGYDQQSSSTGYHRRNFNADYGTQRSANGGYRQQPSPTYHRQDPTPGFDRDPTRSGYGSQTPPGSYNPHPLDTYSQQSSSNGYSEQSSSNIYNQQPLSSSYHQRPSSSGNQQYSPSGDRQRPSESPYGQRPSTGAYTPPGNPQSTYNQQPPRTTGYGEPPSNDYSRQPSNSYGQPPVGNQNYQSGFSDPGKSHVSSASKPNTRPTGDLNQIPGDKCPPGFSGLAAHSNPTKFLSCANGRAFVMDCGPGTWFDEAGQMCGFPPVSTPSEHAPEQESYVGQRGITGDTEEVAESYTAPKEYNPDLDVRGAFDPEPQDQVTAATSSHISAIVERRMLVDFEQVHKPHPDNPALKGFFIEATTTPRPKQREQTTINRYVTERPKETFKPDYDGRSSHSKSYPHPVYRHTTTVSPPQESEEDFFQPRIGFIEEPERIEPVEVKTSAPFTTTTKTPVATEATRIHVFRPNESLPLMNKRVRKPKQLDRQILRLRGGPSQSAGFVEIQLSPSSWGLLCDQQNQWTTEEADIVCQHLGYSRGAKQSWQGQPIEGAKNLSKIVSVDSITCLGHEETITECSLRSGNGCDINRDAVWVQCYDNNLSQCRPGEVPFEDKCYLLVVPDVSAISEGVGFSQEEASDHCRKRGGHLLIISSQVENDFISEWLLRLKSVEKAMTAGVGAAYLNTVLWMWEDGSQPFDFTNWWPGWEGGRGKSPTLEAGRAGCIVAKRHFPCPAVNSTSEPRICDAQYYYWDVEDCGFWSSKQPYICERKADDIGCLVGAGLNYQGKANVTEKGHACITWDDTVSEISYKLSAAKFKETLSGHNYCRNIGGLDPKPWCFVKSGGRKVKEYCDIPKCTRGIEKSAQFIDSSCKSNEFSCGDGKQCIPEKLRCNGKQDCKTGLDEFNCAPSLAKYQNHLNKKLLNHTIESIPYMSVYLCSERCSIMDDCRSFSYSLSDKTCILSHSNLGLSGDLVQEEDGWHYYELISKSLNCDLFYVCGNGKCVSNSSVCNGHDDCGDRTDEESCSWGELGISLKLTGGSNENEGLIQVKVQEEWGLICDDQFDMKDADVICRQLGFTNGALEILKHSSSLNDKKEHAKYMIDDLQCHGNESSILECEHAGWGVHNCGPDEAVGIVCKDSTVTDCGSKFWQCNTSRECIPFEFLCDNVSDCADGSDEDIEQCKAPIKVRLVGFGEQRGGKSFEGRVEIKRFGVWGTVCDDDFGPTEAQVVCNSLGYNGPAKVFKEAAFGPGRGIIWLDQVHCQGNELDISDCIHETWGQSNCKHNEDVSVSCTPQNTPVRHKDIHKQRHKPLSSSVVPNLNDILPKSCGNVSKNLGATSPLFMPKVVSGFETLKGSNPWQASIRVRTSSGRSTHWCGAVVISKFHILTAGHCLRDYNKSAYFIRAGDFDKDVDEGTEQELELEEIWIHPQLDEGARLNNDIAVAKVKTPGFIFNSWVSPVCLPTGDEVYDSRQRCSISGWGSNGVPGTGFSRTLHAAWLPMIPSSSCQAKEVYGSDVITKGMFCAGSLNGGPDSCQGDSGGPFTCVNEDRHILFGITSWGHGCGRVNRPGVYTKVSEYMDWLRKKLVLSMINF